MVIDPQDPGDVPPFDEFNNQAIRYRCPATNTRNSNFFYPHTRYCRAQYVSFAQTAKREIKNRCRTFPVFTPTFNGHKACHTNPALVAVRFVQPGHSKNPSISCKTTGIFSPSTTSAVGKCSVRYRVKFLVRAAYPATCHWNKKAISVRPGVRLCRSIRTINPNNIRHTRMRMFCNRFARFIGTGQRPCFKYGVSAPIQTMRFRTNVRTCFATEILDYSKYVSNFVCKIHVYTTNVTVQFGSKVKTGMFSCKTYPLLVRYDIGYKLCLNRVSFSATKLRWRVWTCVYSAKIFYVEDRPGRRFRCGTGVAGFSSLLIFGRVWGGRNPIFGLPIQSGRMISKTRPE